VGRLGIALVDTAPNSVRNFFRSSDSVSELPSRDSQITFTVVILTFNSLFTVPTLEPRSMCALKRKRQTHDRRIILHKVRDVELTSPRLLSNTKVLLQIEGSKSREIGVQFRDEARGLQRGEARSRFRHGC
jgi:hypothetical protein